MAGSITMEKPPPPIGEPPPFPAGLVLDLALSTRECGLLLRLLTQPATTLTRADVEALAPDLGSSALDTTLQGLAAKGYLERRRVSGGRGRIAWTWKLSY